MARYKHKYKYIPILSLVLFLTLPLGACLNLKQPRNKIEYYTLEYDPPLPGNRQPLSDAIRVDQFAVSPIYNTNRIIYRDGSFKREAYVYYKWRANPGDVVTYFLRRDMQQSGLFKAVVSLDSHLPSAWVLEGTVDEFLEWDKKNGWEAYLSLSVTFMRENEPDISKKILFQKTYLSNKPCRQKNPKALAEAMSSAMSEVSGQIIHDIYTFIVSRRLK
jgi:cholesterol transport system auxiliary component